MEWKLRFFCWLWGRLRSLGSYKPISLFPRSLLLIKSGVNSCYLCNNWCRLLFFRCWLFYPGLWRYFFWRWLVYCLFLIGNGSFIYGVFSCLWVRNKHLFGISTDQKAWFFINQGWLISVTVSFPWRLQVFIVMLFKIAQQIVFSFSC